VASLCMVGVFSSIGCILFCGGVVVLANAAGAGGGRGGWIGIELGIWRDGGVVM